MNRLIVTVLAMFVSVSAASASVDTTPEKTVEVSCTTVRALVAAYGADAVASVARAQGVSERDIALLARKCLR